MALIFLGESKCGVCRKVLDVDDNVLGLPAISNTKHRLYEYFDQGFHQECFDNWKEWKEVLALIEVDKS